MAGRIVLFGATGYTGELTARELVRQGARPLLLGRDREALERLSGELGGLEVAEAQAGDADSVRAHVERGDVLLTCVGPFSRLGETAVEVAIEQGAAYIDSTGEPPFIRRVFEEWSPRAQQAMTPLLTAMGYDFVPGNVAAVVACNAADGRARRVDVGYFFSGKAGPSAMSAGTRASLAAAATEPAYSFRDGAVVTERGAARVRSFTVDGKARSGVSIGASEHFAVPREVPSLQHVNVYLGWFGPMSRVVQAASAATGLVQHAPGGERAVHALMERMPKAAPRSGPDATERAGLRSNVVAIAYDEHDHAVGAARMHGANAYEFTASMLAWAAQQAAMGPLRGTGALGPVQAFGLDTMRRACKAAGLPVVEELATD